MKLSPTARLNQLLLIFTRYRVSAGGWLDYADVVVGWKRTGLRSSDLETVLDLAADCGMIDLDPAQGGASVRLLRAQVPPGVEKRTGLRRAAGFANDLRVAAKIRLRKPGKPPAREQRGKVPRG